MYEMVEINITARNTKHYQEESKSLAEERGDLGAFPFFPFLPRFGGRVSITAFNIPSTLTRVSYASISLLSTLVSNTWTLLTGSVLALRFVAVARTGRTADRDRGEEGKGDDGVEMVGTLSFLDRSSFSER